MARYVVSYDLNGSKPTHAEMDKHIEKVTTVRARILETVWYVGAYAGTAAQLRDHIKTVLSSNDLLEVTTANDMAWTKLLITDAQMQALWAKG